MKLLLYMYEMMAGLKINFNKSEVIMINDNDNQGSLYADIFNCQVSAFPVKYLGVPVCSSRLHLSDWNPLVEKYGKKLDIWKGGIMSIAGRSTLICTCHNNSSIQQMSVYWPLRQFQTRLIKLEDLSFGKVEVLRGSTTQLNGLKSARVKRKQVWELKTRER